MQHITWYKRPRFVAVLCLSALVLLSYLAYSFAYPRVVEKLAPIPCTVDGAIAHRDVTYTKHPGFNAQTASLDLYLPQRHGDCPVTVPLVIWVHGGSFMGGDKAAGIDYKKQLFVGEGWAFASVGYRLTSAAQPVVHPAQTQDVAAAIGWLHQNQQRYSLDTDRIMLIGYSAGAYLVSLISTDSTYVEAEGLETDAIICTVSLDTGAYDLPRYMQSDDGAVSVYKDILGHDVNSWQQHSPQHLAASAKYLPDFLLVTRGDGIRPNITRSFGEVLMKKQSRAKVLDADQYTHSDLDAMLGMPGDTVLSSEVVHFFRSCTN